MVSAILVLITWISGFIIRSLVSDSAISYEVTNFFKLNIYSVIGFIVLSCVSMGYFIFSHILFQFLDELMPSNFLVKPLLISFLGLVVPYGWIESRQMISFDLGLLFWLIIYLLLVSWSGNKGERRISGSSTVFWLVFFSASITIIIFTENSKRELEIRKSAAVKLASSPIRQVIF